MSTSGAIKSNLECPICGEKFCKKCIERYLDKMPSKHCPICRKTFRKVDIKDDFLLNTLVDLLAKKNILSPDSSFSSAHEDSTEINQNEDVDKMKLKFINKLLDEKENEERCHWDVTSIRANIDDLRCSLSKQHERLGETVLSLIKELEITRVIMERNINDLGNSLERYNGQWNCCNLCHRDQVNILEELTKCLSMDTKDNNQVLRISEMILENALDKPHCMACLDKSINEIRRNLKHIALKLDHSNQVMTNQMKFLQTCTKDDFM